ncbi:MAG: phosphoglucosamine mutase [Bacteroidetes bacterium QS_8_64_10]|nr:MAG: phosphoglucosamine mutase [Bacteroidetes bacterium QS_8_64_10]
MDKTLIRSISGIRGIFGRGLDPGVLVRYAAAFGTWCLRRAETEDRAAAVVVGRDGRVTGPLCQSIVVDTLRSTGCDVVVADMATTPTVEMAVLAEEAAGGIILSASHNPAAWNALKLLNHRGEFLTPDEAEALFEAVDDDEPSYVGFEDIGERRERDFLEHHVESVLALDYIDAGTIADEDFHVVVDGINSVGAVAMPELLAQLGVSDVEVLNGEPTGRFAHEAEPLKENLTGLMERVRETGADLGLAVDPDADRLAFVTDEGDYLGEEMTQVAAADFLWQQRSGPFVTNLSSSRTIEDVAGRYGEEVHRSSVGEINVVEKMKEVGAVLGGEGNGGIIPQDLHYGRDALAGTAMVLQHLANEQAKLSALQADYPSYEMVKDKVPLGEGDDPDELLQHMEEAYRSEELSTIDGVKIDFENSWVHMRASNTEPIIRVYAEAPTRGEARELTQRFMKELQQNG